MHSFEQMTSALGLAWATFQVLPQVALWSYKEIETWMPTAKVVAETKVAAFIQLD